MIVMYLNLMPKASQKRLEYIKQWQKANVEKRKATERAYRERHREERLDYSKRHYQTHKEEKHQYNIQWRLKNPEKYRAQTERNNERIKRERLPRRILFVNKRIELDRNPRTGKCLMCGNIGRTEMHHIQYHRDDPLKETVEVCARCHRAREQKYGEWKGWRKKPE